MFKSLSFVAALFAYAQANQVMHKRMQDIPTAEELAALAADQAAAVDNLTPEEIAAAQAAAEAALADAGIDVPDSGAITVPTVPDSGAITVPVVTDVDLTDPSAAIDAITGEIESITGDLETITGGADDIAGAIAEGLAELEA